MPYNLYYILLYIANICSFEFLPKGLYELQGLEILVASDNHIKTLNVAGLEGLPRLNTLDLRNNDIEYVPPILGNLTNIT